MECKVKNEYGTIYLAEDVMLKVVGYAALECYGGSLTLARRKKRWRGCKAFIFLSTFLHFHVVCAVCLWYNRAGRFL